eukprot:scaffold1254_cov376-Prasinococcus_capsulatus_cf.AAC.5
MGPGGPRPAERQAGQEGQHRADPCPLPGHPRSGECGVGRMAANRDAFPVRREGESARSPGTPGPGRRREALPRAELPLPRAAQQVVDGCAAPRARLVTRPLLPPLPRRHAPPRTDQRWPIGARAASCGAQVPHRREAWSRTHMA